MSEIVEKRYVHRDGPFNGHSTGAEYVRVIGEKVELVYPDGKVTDLSDNLGHTLVEFFIENGWWVEVEV